MALIGRVRWRDVPWGWFASALLLTAVGVAFVASACYAPTEPYGLGREARMQLVWWGVAVLGCLLAMHVPLSGWKQLAIPLFVICILLELFMMLAAGTPLVPRIKGQCNWIALGPLRLQPVEFIKLGALLMCARLVAAQSFDARRLMHCAAALAIAALPALLVAREDLGSALVFPFMVLGILVVAGMRWSYFAATILLMGACVAAVVMVLPKDGPKAYQYKRIQAWMHPDDYALTEGYQTMRSMRSIGSGQWLGKGYGNGDQNRLGWLPEKHTDLIFAVVGEEIGFVGSGAVLGLFLIFAWLGLHAAAQARDPCARNLITGFVCLLIGQASINLAVAMGLMPVTGVTLPFFSYGGSSLLASYLGLGSCLAAASARRD